jgi:hypothetical protein
VGIEPMHVSPAAQTDCVVCHGGRADTTDKLTAHVAPRNREVWTGSANPQRSYAALNRESPEFVRFINPGDLRIADQSCGKSRCHTDIVTRVRTSMMSHGAFLWGAALYNNGAFPLKRPVFGESYSHTGASQKLTVDPAPTPAEMKSKGWLPELWPLPQFEATEPGNTLRVFERGDDRLSNRGFGTLTRTDPVFQGLQRTRLLDPLLYFLGTNDQPGDYRSSGCTACHVVYANDRDPAHSGRYATRGHLGYSFTADPTIKKNEEGHPIQHRLTRSIPSSQCVVCHMHPGTSFASQYYGYMWWDNETDGDRMYPAKTKTWKPAEAATSLLRNPEAASLKGNWSDPAFLRNVRDLNKDNKQTQFADFNGHGWIYRAARATGSIRTITKSISRIRRNSTRPCTCPIFTSTKGCTASIAISSRIATATAASMANRAPPSRSIAWIATVRSAPAPRSRRRTARLRMEAAISPFCALRSARGASNTPAVS